MMIRKHIGALLILVCFSSAEADVLDLDRVPETLDHGLEIGRGLDFERIGWASDYYGTGDLDGDGDRDLAMFIEKGFMAFAQEDHELRILWQENLPVEHRRIGTDLRLAVCRDLDGDGLDEIAYSYRSSDQGYHGLCIVNHYGEDRIREFSLPIGEDLNGDGRWDGWYFIVGTVPGALPDGRPGLLLGCVVGYDRYNRGLRLIDPADGTEVWRYETGPNPTNGESLIADLDGDGQVEIVLASNSPHNLGGELVNGSSDDRAWIFVLNTDGTLRWAKPQGIHFFSLDLTLGDLTGDGLPELVSSTRHHSAGASGDTLTVFDPRSGEILAWDATVAAVNGQAIGVDRIRRRSNIICANTIGELFSYELRGEHLERKLLARAEGSLKLLGHGEVISGSHGSETVLSTTAGRLLLLDDLHRPLASCESPYLNNQSYLCFDIWRASPDRSYLIGNSELGRFGMTPTHRPAPLPAKLPLGLLTVLLLSLSLLIGLAFRQRFLKPAQDTGCREQLLRVLGELEDARHGHFPATEALARLLNMIRLAEEGESPRVRTLPRLSLALVEFKEATLPRLQGILEQAETCRLSIERARETRITLDSVVDTMDHLLDRELSADILEAELEPLSQSCSRVEQDLLSIRDAARRQFSAEPRAMLGRLLALRTEVFSARGIDLEVEGEETAGACHIDPADLHYILDNLVDNAIRAMNGHPEARLMVAISSIGSKLRIDMRDSGVGIPSTRRRTVFEPGFTTRDEGERGGFGLSRSRELLRRWGGKLELLESEEGQGSRFRLTLPLVGRSTMTRPPRKAVGRGVGAN
jgi:signal transduction histidine kinase